MSAAEYAAGETGTRTREANAVRDGLNIGFSSGMSGLAWGAAAIPAGLSVQQACALSILAFSGASQFAIAGVVSGGGALFTGTLGAVMLAGRNALYGLRLADLLRVQGWRRAVCAHFVIDETTAVATAQPDRASARVGFFATGIPTYALWNITTFIGAIGATRLGDPERYGLDLLGPAMFLGLLWPRLTAGATEVRVAVLGALIAVLAVPVLPTGVPIMVAAFAALLGLRERQRERERVKEPVR
ncbi:branched-chain amino acid ABC transporter permease [Actinomadura rayongensis]|uniref:Branched-chain amino acid ABC transporter permease n=2 Tax=Actinomadura rayongensis TaxID=1429076 RepID=A0A6I4W741_9ACTN|nr:branched-chain amino acid ABC transporter permease [Actinomadura rayongensis]